jgi:hypothetical protein
VEIPKPKFQIPGKSQTQKSQSTKRPLWVLIIWILIVCLGFEVWNLGFRVRRVGANAQFSELKLRQFVPLFASW